MKKHVFIVTFPPRMNARPFLFISIEVPVEFFLRHLNNIQYQFSISLLTLQDFDKTDHVDSSKS